MAGQEIGRTVEGLTWLQAIGHDDPTSWWLTSSCKVTVGTPKPRCPSVEDERGLKPVGLSLAKEQFLVRLGALLGRDHDDVVKARDNAGDQIGEPVETREVQKLNAGSTGVG
jgi:hypothetical protein